MRSPRRQIAIAIDLSILRPVALATAVLCGGCSVNDHGLVRVRSYENETSYVVSLESWGLHLSTTSGDGGVTLGYLTRTYVFRKGEGAAKIPLAALTGGGGTMSPASCDPCPTLSELAAPVFQAGEGVGLTIDANSNRFGIAFGLRRRAALALPTDGSAVVLLRYDAADTVPSQVILGKEIER